MALHSQWTSGMLQFYDTSDPATMTLSAADSTLSGSVLAISSTPITASGLTNTVKVETYLAPAAKTASGGAYAGRFVAGVATAKTLAPTAAAVYLSGVQGKLDPAGAIGDGTGTQQIYASAGLSQVNNGGGSFGSECQLYGHWIDNQFAGNGPATSHMLNITNNGGNIANVIHVYGNNKYTGQFMALETLGSVAVTITGNASHQTKALLVTLDGVQYYLPLQSAIN